jgi:hypothetical protein
MKYYVYELINSLDNKPIYIGKGKNRRMFIHENRAKKQFPIKGENLKLRNKIHSIWKKDGKIKYNKIFFTDNSLEAYNKETNRILEIGIVNLCNLVIYPFTPEDAYKRKSAQMVGKRHSELTKDKIRRSLVGHFVSEETRIKMKLKKIGKLNPCSEQKRINISNSLKPVGGWKDVISPNGEKFSVNILSDFCRTHDLCVSGLSELLNGKKHSYKGWSVSLI